MSDLFLKLFLCVLSVYGMLYAWFRTNLLLEYAQFLGFGRWLALAQWQALPKESAISYIAFLRARFGSSPGVMAFGVRMLTCHACLGFWLALLASICAGHWWMCYAVYGAAMALYSRL